jgi:hypothetical protein
VLDRCGPRIRSVINHATIATGCQVFASATQFHEFAVASCLLAFGGPGIQVSIVHLANLFPENQFTALSLLNGTISISFLVFEVFSWIWQQYEWIGYQQLFGWFSVVVGISLLASVCFWPDHSFKAPKKTTSSKNNSTNATSTSKSSSSLIIGKEPTLEDDYIEAITAHPHLVEQPLDLFLRKQDSSHQIERHHSFILSRKIHRSRCMGHGQSQRCTLSSTIGEWFLCARKSLFWRVLYVASITTEVRHDGEPLSSMNHFCLLACLVACGGSMHLKNGYFYLFLFWFGRCHSWQMRMNIQYSNRTISRNYSH